MANKYEVEQNLLRTIETNGKLTKHIEALWEEIGQKQSRISDLNWEISELKSENTDLSTKIKECMEKRHSIKRAQYQKDWLEHFNPMKTDN